MMRVITGVAKGKKLKTLEGDATRPTSERIKGAIFSSIQFEIEGRRVLDLFAGSGQMSLEALSRGAKFAVMLDSSPAAIKIITENAEKTRLAPKCLIKREDYLSYIKKNAGKQFDIIFLDPPYNSRQYGANYHMLNTIAEYDSFVPKGKRLMAASLTNCFPKGIPIIVMHQRIPQKSAVRAISQPKSAIQRILKRVLPNFTGSWITSFLNGRAQSPAILKH